MIRPKYVLNRQTQQTPLEMFAINGSMCSDKATIAHAFNEYFTNLGPTLAGKIPNLSRNPLSYLTGDFKDSFVLYETTASEIINTVNRFKSKTSAGYDDIPVDIMKFSILHTAPYLAKIINLSFTTGLVPNMLKIAKVCPIYKKNGDKTDINNYRPISILPSFSKIYEKLVYNRLSQYVKKFCILNDCQFGFRSNRSTSMAVLEMTDKINEATENNQFSIGVFVDLSKAFDTLNHNILLNKLYYYGIRGVSYEWFKSYLSNRYQYVHFNGYSSSRLPITCGVPQGSILGPLLFLIYINDICHVAKKSHLILFADDTNIFVADHNLNNLICNINYELQLISEWFQVNKLSLNVNKTNFVFFVSPKNVMIIISW